MSRHIFHIIRSSGHLATPNVGTGAELPAKMKNYPALCDSCMAETERIGNLEKVRLGADLHISAG